MSIDKDLSDRPMEGRAPGDSFGKKGVPADLTKALAEPALRVERRVGRAPGRGARRGAAWGREPAADRRNGSNPETVATDSDKVLPGIPRYRNGSFDPIPIAKDRRRGDGRGNGLAKPAAGAILSGRLHGPDPGRHSQVSNTALFGASAILPDGTGDVLGLWFQANEGATVRAKGLNDLRNRSIQDIPIAAVDAEAAEAAPVEVEDRDLVAKYPAPAPNWRRARTEGIPFLDDPPEGRKPIHTATAIEAQTSKPPRGGSDPGTLPERRGRSEIDLSRADCDLSEVGAARAIVAGREKPARHHVRRPLPNGVTKVPAHRIQTVSQLWFPRPWRHFAG